VGRLEGGTVFTTQWIDPEYGLSQRGDTLSVTGQCHVVPTQTFTPAKMMAFRATMMAVGWSHQVAKDLKGLIRTVLMTQARRAPVRFTRRLEIGTDAVEVTDEVELGPGARVSQLKVGDDLPLRYVPQSRYFQPQELEAVGLDLTPAELAALNAERRFRLIRRVSAAGCQRVEGTA
jgi:hypothetical protein